MVKGDDNISHDLHKQYMQQSRGRGSIHISAQLHAIDDKSLST